MMNLSSQICGVTRRKYSYVSVIAYFDRMQLEYDLYFQPWSKMSSIMIMQDRQYSKLSDTFLHFKDFLSIN